MFMISNVMQNTPCLSCQTFRLIRRVITRFARAVDRRYLYLGNWSRDDLSQPNILIVSFKPGPLVNPGRVNLQNCT
jgi:hypothetical protein